MIEGRGLHMKDVAVKNMQRIEKYAADNPYALQKDICEALGLTQKTLRQHLKTLGIKKTPYRG